MPAATETYADWLAQAQIPEARLTPEQHALLRAAFRFRQQHLSAKEAIQQAHHRLDGRPYGKLLPRYAGPLAEYLFRHPDASRADLIDFLDQTFGVRVSRIALYHFLKKFGLDHVRAASVPSAADTVPATPQPSVSGPRPTAGAPLPVPPF